MDFIVFKLKISSQQRARRTKSEDKRHIGRKDLQHLKQTGDL